MCQNKIIIQSSTLKTPKLSPLLPLFNSHCSEFQGLHGAHQRKRYDHCGLGSSKLSALTGLHGEGVIPSMKPPKDNSTGAITQKGRRARELLRERRITEGAYMSRCQRSAAWWAVPGSENSKGQQQLGGFYSSKS